MGYRHLITEFEQSDTTVNTAIKSYSDLSAHNCSRICGSFKNEIEKSFLIKKCPKLSVKIFILF
jgi:hypothetical protein